MTDARITAAIAIATPQISSDEGFRAWAYLDKIADPPVWTWGYGETKLGTPGAGRCCTIDQARTWRENRIKAIAGDLTFHLPWWTNLPPEKMAALINMAYQNGMGGLLNFKRMLLALAGQHWDTAAAEALDSKWAKQTPARAQRIAARLRARPVPADPGRNATLAALGQSETQT